MTASILKVASIVVSLSLLNCSNAHAQEAYKLPDNLTPVKKWKHGYSAMEARQFRTAFNETSLPEMGDVGAYAATRLGEVLRTAVIRRRGSVSKLESNPMPEIATVKATTVLGTMTLRKAMDDPKSRMRAIAVVHKGKLVFEEYIGIRPSDSHIWASASKTITGLLIHVLAEEGRIDLDAPVTRYLKDFKGTAWEKVTVADVLHQRSGLDITEDSFAKPGHPMGAFYNTAFAPSGMKVKKSLREIAKGVKKSRKPGELFEYSSMNTQVCGFIVEAVTGKPWSDVATEKIWGKVGMEGDAQIALSPFGEAEAFGVIASRLRDMARYGLLYTPSWKVVAKQRVVSQDYFKKVQDAAKGVGYGSYIGDRLTKDFGMKNLSASYQWDAVFPDGDVYKSGRSGQMLYVSPETDTVVVWFSSTYKSEVWLHAYARNIVQTLFRKGKNRRRVELRTSPTKPKKVMDTIPAVPASQVTLMNCFKPPFNKWAFRNMGIHPSLMVPRGDETVKLPAKKNARIPTLRFKWDGKAYSVREAIVGDNTDGIVVVKDGTIVYEEYFGKFTERDHHLWASSAKSLTGLCMGILVDQGKLDVSKKVETYLPELRGTHFGERTVRQVLNMVTALDYSEDYENFKPGTVSTEYFRRLGFVPAFDLMALDPTGSKTPRGLIGFLPRFKVNPELKPGQKFEYHSPNVDVTGSIIARVSGKPLQTFVADEVWNKLGVEHDAFYMADFNFNAVATGGFNTTLRDFARVGLAVLNNGKYNGHQVFPKAWVKSTFALTKEERMQVANSSYKDKDAAVFDPWLEGYKNFLWVHDSKKGIGTFRGVFGQNLYINQDANLVIATFSSATSASNAARATNKPRMAAFDAIAKYLK